MGENTIGQNNIGIPSIQSMVEKAGGNAETVKDIDESIFNLADRMDGKADGKISKESLSMLADELGVDAKKFIEAYEGSNNTLVAGDYLSLEVGSSSASETDEKKDEKAKDKKSDEKKESTPEIGSKEFNKLSDAKKIPVYNQAIREREAEHEKLKALKKTRPLTKEEQHKYEILGDEIEDYKNARNKLTGEGNKTKDTYDLATSVLSTAAGLIDNTETTNKLNALNSILKVLKGFS